MDSDSARQPFMDAISALTVAGDILAVTDFSVELLSASDLSKVSLPEERGETSALENLEKLRQALSKKLASLEQRLSASPSPPLKDELALLELAFSSLEDSGVLLEAIRSIPKDFPENRSHSSERDTRDWVISRLAGKFGPEKVKQLSQAVTSHASSILR